jgi:RHS repeat-associated protein
MLVASFAQLLLCTQSAAAATVAAVGTSTNNAAVSASHQRKAFYANGRHWVFYADGTNLVWQSSTDGASWATKATVRACTTGTLFGLAFDGTYVHYAYAKATAQTALYYRRGLPNADGTITWSAAEQTAVAAVASTTYKTPAIAVDSSGYVWIGFFQDDTSDFPRVTKSSTTNGTWTTASGFPHQLSTTASTTWAVTPVALQSGRVLVVYSRGGAKVSSKLWKGSAWASERASFTGYGVNSNGVRVSAVAVGDDVHILYLKVSPYAVRYVKFTYNSSDATYYGAWGGETALQASVTSTSAPVLARDGATNDLYCFWAGSPTANHIYYTKRTAAGVWDTSPTDWHDQSAEAITAYDRITAYAASGGSMIGVLFTTKTASPYNVRLAQLTLGGAPQCVTGDCCDTGTGTFRPSSYVCRAAAGGCDVEEKCTGASATCPSDTKRPAGYSCRASAGACDVAEACDGTSVACPTDAFLPSGTECRAGVGPCDLPESCTGASAVCPADAFATAGTVCRPSAGVCDVAETCTGSSTTCPADGFLASGTLCRPAAGACDQAESCSGWAATCPADALTAAGTVCRAAAGVCDQTESCNGFEALCPTDAKVAAGTQCRASGGACDPAEACTGLADACPADGKLPAGTECRASTGTCDPAEACDGSSNTCPGDALAANGTACPGGTCQTGVCIEQLSTNWTDVGTHPLGAKDYSVTRLADGRVVVAGGQVCNPYCAPKTEVYIYSGGTFTLWGKLSWQGQLGEYPHYIWGHKSLVLNDGRVVLYDGREGTNSCHNGVVILNIDAGTWTARAIDAYFSYRCGFAATVLDNGKVLITGGYNQYNSTTPGPAQQDGRLWDPVADTWIELYPSWNYGPTIARANHYQVKLPNGKVLIGGGGTLATEIYDPAGIAATGATGTFAATANSPSRVRSKNGAVLVPSGPYAGKVLAVGGVSPNAEGELCDRCMQWIEDEDYDEGGYWEYYLCAFHACSAGLSQYTHRTDVFDPATNTWSAPGGALDLPAQRASFGFGVVGGQIIAAGGNSNGSDGLLVHKFDPAAGSWSAMTNLPASRIGPTVVALITQAALVAGPSGAFYQYSFTTCGNGTKGSTEQCDEGLANGTAASCCNANCTLKTAGTLCRAADGECDVAETCTGASGACPADAKVADGTSCTDRVSSNCSRAACLNGSCDQNAGAPTPAGTQCRYANECGGNAYCDGTTKVCPTSYKPAGTACTPAQCDECDGWPSCESRWCYKHTVCTGSSDACPTTCDTDAQCESGYACVNQACQAKQANGAACTTGALCLSGNCVDGYCCNATCAETCKACSNAKTGVANGTCAAVKVNTDPDGECGNLTCNGASACRTTCASASECKSNYSCVSGSCLPPVGACVGGHPPDSLADQGGGGNPPDGVQGAVGTFGHGLEITVPVYHAIQPRLALSYNSASPDGSAGVGWNLGGAVVIERASPGRGAPRYDATDIYLLGGQELIPCQAGSPSPSCTTCPVGYTCYSTKIESFDRIGTSGGTWTVWSKAGVKATLSPTFTTPAGTFRWLLTKVESKVSGSITNTVDYGWWCDGSSPILDCYLGTITYNGNTVQMHWESRPDQSMFATGASIGQTRYRLRSVVVKVGSTVARVYALAYATAATGGGQSLLQSVTQYGRDTVVDSNGAVTSGQSLPAQTFTWTLSGGFSGETLQPQNQLYAQAGDEGHKKGLGDVNGDGRQDYCYIRKDYRQVWCRLGATSGAPEVETRWVDFSSAPGIGDINVWGFADLNGDGKDDFFYKGDNGKYLYVGLSSGAAFATPSYWGAYTDKIGGENTQWYMIDLNRDGKADFIYEKDSDNDTKYYRALLSTGAGFASEQYIFTRLYNAEDNDSKNRNWFADVNGDGCPDHVYKRNGGAIRVLLSNWCRGLTTFQPDTQWGTATDGNAWGMAVDVNGDGKADYVQSSGRVLKVHLSTGTNFAPEADWGTHSNDVFKIFKWMTDVDGDGVVDFVYQRSGTYSLGVLKGTGTGFGTESTLLTRAYDAQGDDSNNNIWFADFTGDGRPDLLYRRASTYELRMFTSQGLAGVLMTGLTNGMGGSETITYGSSTAYANTNRPPTTPVVTQVSQSWGGVTTYTYAGGLFDWVERVPLGFRYAKKTLPCIAGEATCPYSETWFSQDYATFSRPERVDVRTGSGVLMTSSQEVYTLSGDGTTTPYQALLTGTWAFAYDGTGNTCGSWPCASGMRSYVSRSYDAFGNRIEESTYGDYDRSGDERTKSYVYRPNTSLYVVSLPAVERIFQGIGTGGTLLDEGQTLYDGNGTWDAAPTLGNVTKVRRLVTAGSYMEQAKEYDAFGNLTAEIKTLQSSPLVQQKTTFVYDPTFNIFPIEERGPLYQVDTRHKTLRVFDAACAGATQTTDPNGLVTTQERDVFCRPTRVTKPTGEVETTSYVSFGDAAAQYVQVERTPPPGVTGNLWSRSYKDGAGRTYKTITRGPAAAGDVVAEMVYTARGRVASASAPRFSSEAAAWTTHSYDALDRLVRTTHPDGAFATRTHGLNVVTVTDECGGQTSEFRNALGQVTQRRQWRNGAALDTFFQYNAKDQLTLAIDPKGNRFSVTYNALGQRETVTDPDSGTTTYAYDEAGRVTEVRNALNQRVVTQYDLADRKTMVTLKRADGSTEDTITVTYDQARAGYYNVGAATTVTDSTGSVQTDYDVGGRAAKVQRVLFGTPYVTESGFDSAGRTLWTTYPDGDTLGTPATPLVYNELGKPRVIPGYMTDATYNARGYLASLTRADGTITTYTYDANRLWLKRIRTTRDATVIQDLDYTINAVGQVAQVVSPFADETWTYGYDSAGFLTSAVSSNASHSQSWTYDDTGNILTATRPEGGGTWSYGYNSAHGPGSVRPHAVVAAGSTAYTYDAAGNMLTGAGRTFTWSVNGKPTAITTPTGSFSFAYDGNGGRVMKTFGAVTTYYPFPGYEVTSGVVTKYIGFGAVKLAKKVGGVKYFLHTDHQGSVRVVTNDQGAEIERIKYRPNGERITAGGGGSLGFRGQRQDETGLLYMNVRYYDPQLGRFISADPAVPSASLVGLNRYAYSGNDPVGNFENGNSFSSIFKFLKGIVIGILISMALVAMGMTNPWLIAFWSGFIQGMGESLVAGAPLKDSLKAGLIGGVMSVATKAVSDFVVQGLQMMKAAIKQFQAVAKGASMGGGGINNYDFGYDGNYVVEQGSQADPYHAARISKKAAGIHIKETGAGVHVAGSNKSLAEAFADAQAWAAQQGYKSVVLVYPPQRAGIFTYSLNLTGNSAARDTLAYLYGFAKANDIQLHVSGHSWGAWIAASVAITHGAPTSNVKLDLYNVATMPQGWSTLRRALNTWENRVTLITGTRSGFNDVTHITLDHVYGTGVGVTNPGVKIEWRSAGHGVAEMLRARQVPWSLGAMRASELMH